MFENIPDKKQLLNEEDDKKLIKIKKKCFLFIYIAKLEIKKYINVYAKLNF